jgi:hypothetical protein
LSSVINLASANVVSTAASAAGEGKRFSYSVVLEKKSNFGYNYRCDLTCRGQRVVVEKCIDVCAVQAASEYKSEMLTRVLQAWVA